MKSELAKRGTVHDLKIFLLICVIVLDTDMELDSGGAHL